jgi:hypothetical protein
LTHQPQNGAQDENRRRKDALEVIFNPKKFLTATELFLSFYKLIDQENRRKSRVRTVQNRKKKYLNCSRRSKVCLDAKKRKLCRRLTQQAVKVTALDPKVKKHYHLAYFLKELMLDHEFDDAWTRLDQEVLERDDAQRRSADWDVLYKVKAFSILDKWQALRQEESIEKNEEKQHLMQEFRPSVVLPDRASTAESTKAVRPFMQLMKSLSSEIANRELGDVQVKYNLAEHQVSIRNYFRDFVSADFPDMEDWSSSEDDESSQPKKSPVKKTAKESPPKVSAKPVKESPVKSVKEASSAKSAKKSATMPLESSARSPVKPSSKPTQSQTETPASPEKSSSKKFVNPTTLFDLAKLQEEATKRSQSIQGSPGPQPRAEQRYPAARTRMYAHDDSWEKVTEFDTQPSQRRQTAVMDSVLPKDDRTHIQIDDDDDRPSIPNLNTNQIYVNSVPIIYRKNPPISQHGPSQQPSKRPRYRSSDDEDVQVKAKRVVVVNPQDPARKLKIVDSVLELEEAELVERAIRAKVGRLTQVPGEYRTAGPRIKIPWTATEAATLRTGMLEYVTNEVLTFVRYGKSWALIKRHYGAPGQPLEYRSVVDLKDKARTRGFGDILENLEA